MKNCATLKVVLDPKDSSEKKLLKLRVTFNRRSHFYSLNSTKRLSAVEFSNDKLKVNKDAMLEVKNGYDIAAKIVSNLGKDFSFETFKSNYKDELFGKKKDYTRFSSFADDYINHLDVISTKQMYKTSINWVERIHPGIRLESITEAFVDSMVSDMKDNGVSENTVRIYCRQLKAIYQEALKNSLVKGQNPFNKYAKPSIGRSISGLTNEEFAILKTYKPKNKEAEFGQDFFILSFACAGANIGDILRFTNGNIQGNQIHFYRQKTKKNPKPVVIPFVSKAEKILQKYGHINRQYPEHYILPFLKSCKTEMSIKNKVHDVVQRINKGLAIISEDTGLRKITTYDARHTYSNLLLLQPGSNLKETQIQKLLGHSSLKTTMSYLGQLSNQTLEESKKTVNRLLEDDNIKKEQALDKDLIDALCERFGKEEVMSILDAQKKR